MATDTTERTQTARDTVHRVPGRADQRVQMYSVMAERRNSGSVKFTRASLGASSR